MNLYLSILYILTAVVAIIYLCRYLSRPKWPSYTVTVNYDKSVDEQLDKDKYNFIDSNINSNNFPSTKKGTASVTIYLMNFKDINSFKTEYVISEMKKQGLCPATLEELLALEKKDPIGAIVALGSFWCRSDDKHYVPYISTTSWNRRRVYLAWCGATWSPAWQFACKRK